MDEVRIETGVVAAMAMMDWSAAPVSIHYYCLGSALPEVCQDVPAVLGTGPVEGHEELGPPGDFVQDQKVQRHRKETPSCQRVDFTLHQHVSIETGRKDTHAESQTRLNQGIREI